MSATPDDDPKWRKWPILATLYGQWKRVRGSRVDTASRAFSRDWSVLLESARIESAQDIADAECDVRVLERVKLVKITPDRKRPHLIKAISIPTEAESRLCALFGESGGAELRAQAAEVIAAARKRVHPRLPDEWPAWCDCLLERLAAGKPILPLKWRDIDSLQKRLGILFALTEREWRPQTPVRTASIALGLDSKALEQQQSFLEKALSQLFHQETTLASLGIAGGHPMILLAGPLILEFADRSRADFTVLRGPFTLSENDLERVISGSTTAKRLLTVENAKTPFHQLAAVNSGSGGMETLIVATSYPTAAIKFLLQALPIALPHYHFGDTDPYGFDILYNLRKVCTRPVRPFLMEYRPLPEGKSEPLKAEALHLAETLLTREEMADCRPHLEAMLAAAVKGGYEQESLNAPDLPGWPFYMALCNAGESYN